MRYDEICRIVLIFDENKGILYLFLGERVLNGKGTADLKGSPFTVIQNIFCPDFCTE